ncbi:MAG TPA: alpha/beta fold hydrolase [Solirubrobacteraceae bacterium]|jgi:thioesterase domain-containing protein|nr:alpha/beta fold hydrolase [Solirubrobacteraceae bacterium]
MTASAVNDQLREHLRRLTLPARRPTFESPLPPGESPQSVRLSEGPARTGVVGIPSTVALCGPHQYLEFAKHFRDRRTFFALQVPGFVAGERLPASVQVAVDVEAESVQRCMNGAPVVLAGYSSGGTFAYGIAARLEALGTPVAAVVLIDAYPFRTVNSEAGRTQALLRKMFEDRELRRYLNATRLTAMAWYAQLFMDWELGAIAAPTLMVQPTEPMPGMADDGEWSSVWPHPHDTVRVPGDHWTMMLEDAASTATAVERWIADRVCAQVTQ